MILRPSDCVVAVGIPTDRTGYIRSATRNEQHGVIQGQHVSWPKYEREISRPFVKASRRWRKLGVTVVTSVGLTELAEIFSRYDPRILVIISHSHDGQIELHEGMVQTDKVLQVIPQSYTGTIDLCVCHSYDLAWKLKDARPKVIIKSLQNKAKYTLWFGIYTVVFEYISKKKFIYYSEALDQALDKLAPH